MRGLLIVFEGSEGAGKTTQIARLVADLERAGRRVVPVREPGGTRLGDEIRRFVLDADAGMDPAPAAEALLFMASRAQLVDRVIAPALADGAVVVVDRFFLSTYAYQIDGRGLDAALVRDANALAVGGLVPDLTLLLQVPAEEGLGRANARSGPDRIERIGAAFHARVAAAFARFSDAAWQREHPECGPIVAVDATGDQDTVAERLRAVLHGRWPETFPLRIVSKGERAPAP